MKSSQFILLFLSLTYAHRVFACNSEIGAVQSVGKSVAIEVIKDDVVTGKKISTWAYDDDGILVLSMAMAHCHQKIPVADRTPSNTKPLACKNDVSSIVKKVAIRAKENYAEQSSEAKLAELNLTGVQKKAYVAALAEERDNILKMYEIFSKSSPTNGEFEAAMMKFKKYLGDHEYTFTSDSKQKENPDYLTPLENILNSMGAKLPYVSAMSCHLPMADSVVAKLKNAEWKSRAATGTSAPLQESAVQ